MADGTIIINTQINEEGAKKGVSSLSGIVSKGLGTVAKAGALIGTGVAAATGAVMALTKASVAQYSEYEQLTGGVETLFKKSAGLVERYAGNAFETAGMSANEYMNTITGFSASLLQGLGGDTKKAAQIGNMAVIDMADNANKMGTGIENIQNAYQGFAKQNYTMLDNLKLGYGGTKTEMQRLLADATKLTGVHYDISKFSDVISAIHAVQGQLGITGTTAKEAATTIEGSFNMLKASWTNVLTSMASDNDQLFVEDIVSLEDSVSAFGQNILPRIQIAIQGIGTLIAELLPEILNTIPGIINTTLPQMITAGSQIAASLSNGILQSLPTIITYGLQLAGMLITGIQQALPNIMSVATQIITLLLNGLFTMLPQLLQIGIQVIAQLVDGIAQQLPSLIPAMVQCIATITQTIANNLPQILQSGLNLLQKFTEGIIKAIPILLQNLPQIIQTFVNFIISSLPKILESGVKILLSLINGIVNSIPKLISMLPRIISTIVSTLISHLPQILKTGIQILLKLIDGITNAIPKLISMLPQIINTIVNTLAQHLPQIIAAGLKIIIALNLGLIQAIPKIIGAIGTIVSSIFKAFTQVHWGEIGMNIIKGIGNGIGQMAGWLWNKAMEMCKGVKDKILGFFGIHSPSRLMRDLVGKNIVRGIGVGMDRETPNLNDMAVNDMHSLYSALRGTVDVETAKTTAAVASNNYAYYNSTGGNVDNSKYEPHYTIVNPERTPAENVKALERLDRSRRFKYDR